jgi:hypothetical protein
VLTKFSRHPVWSNVIAGLIVAGILGVITYSLNWWPTITRALTATNSFLWQRTSVPNWLLGFMILIALAALLTVVTVVIANTSRPPTPSWRSYTKDTFEGLTWRWAYDIHGGIYNLTSFCPHCDFEIDPRLGQCESCGRRLTAVDGLIDHIHERIEKLIQQKVRNGTWATPR